LEIQGCLKELRQVKTASDYWILYEQCPQLVTSAWSSLKDWSEEIKQARKGELSPQKAADLKREGGELSRILNILAKVHIDPKIDPCAQAVNERLIL
jgi:hypothetical protein